MFPLKTTKLESKSCSKRVCYHADALQFSTWIISKVIIVDVNHNNHLQNGLRFYLDVTAVLLMENLSLMASHGFKKGKSMVNNTYCQVQVRVPSPNSPQVLTKTENPQNPILWTGADTRITWAQVAQYDPLDSSSQKK